MARAKQTKTIRTIQRRSRKVATPKVKSTKTKATTTRTVKRKRK